MKKLPFLVLILAFLGGTVSTCAQQYRQGDHDGGYGQRYGRQRANRLVRGPHPRDGACFYMTAPFQGHHFCMRAGDRMPNLPNGYGNNISSIAVFGNARVRIFNDSNYRNGSREVWQTVRDLRNLSFRGGHTWNNRISSIKVFYGGGASRYGQPYRRGDYNGGYGQRYDRQRANRLVSGPHPRDGACFYMTAPFQGQHFCMRPGDRMPNLPDGYGNNISSIAVFGNARVRIFNDSNYRNGSREVWRTVRNLRNLSFRNGHTWNNRISSIQVSFAGGGASPYAQQGRRGDYNGGYGQRYDRRRANRLVRGPHPRDGACFYMTAPFRGHHFCMRAGDRMPNLPDGYGNNISSIAVFGDARVRIFNDSDYRNGSREIGRTVRNLRNLSFRNGHTWNNRISSIQVY